MTREWNPSFYGHQQDGEFPGRGMSTALEGSVRHLGLQGSVSPVEVPLELQVAIDAFVAEALPALNESLRNSIQYYRANGLSITPVSVDLPPLPADLISGIDALEGAIAQAQDKPPGPDLDKDIEKLKKDIDEKLKEFILDLITQVGILFLDKILGIVVKKGGLVKIIKDALKNPKFVAAVNKLVESLKSFGGSVEKSWDSLQAFANALIQMFDILIATAGGFWGFIKKVADLSWSGIIQAVLSIASQFVPGKLALTLGKIAVALFPLKDKLKILIEINGMKDALKTLEEAKKRFTPVPPSTPPVPPSKPQGGPIPRPFGWPGIILPGIIEPFPGFIGPFPGVLPGILPGVLPGR